LGRYRLLLRIFLHLLLPRGTYTQALSSRRETDYSEKCTWLVRDRLCGMTEDDAMGDGIWRLSAGGAHGEEGLMYWPEK
jgi:hypothetical protein